MADSQKLKKKRPPFNQQSAIKGAIRRVFSRSDVKKEILYKIRREVPRFNKDGSRGKKDAVQYQCKACKLWVGSTHVEVDHIIPVIEVNDQGFVDWNTYVERLFCGPENLQVLCDPCHDKKTHEEQQTRQAMKDKVALDAIEEKIKFAGTIHEERDLKKQLSKFLTKTKAPETKERAKRLKSVIIDRLTRED
ncbi:MAG: HNH endonuclease signature motif containing protein [bacterium]